MKWTLCLLMTTLFLSGMVKAETDSAMSASGDTTGAAPTEKKMSDTGPHEGRLFQAGTYYLEVLWDTKDQSAKVYLLDIEARNETVQNSEVGIFFLAGNSENEMSCQPVDNHFECKQNGKKNKKGQLSISSKRNGTPAEEVKVKVPFETAAAKPAEKVEKKKKK